MLLEVVVLDIAFFGCLTLIGYMIVDYIRSKQKQKQQKEKLTKGW